MDVLVKRGNCAGTDGAFSRMSRTIVAIARADRIEDNRKRGSIISFFREVNNGTRVEFNEECGASFA
jgi:hypothetical protein